MLMNNLIDSLTEILNFDALPKQCFTVKQRSPNFVFADYFDYCEESYI